jgi:hypothetical protein
MQKIRDNLKIIGMGILAIGAAALAVLKLVMFLKKPDTREKLVEDGRRRGEAAAAEAAAKAKLDQANALADKADSIQEDPEWQNKRDKF